MGIMDFLFGKQEQTQSYQPYSHARPMIRQGLRDAQSLYNQGGFNIQPYGGQMVAGFDPMRADAVSSTPSVVNDAFSRSNAAYGAVSGAMNPSNWMAGLDGVRENIIADVMPAINSSFAMDGRTGGGLHAQNLAKGVTQGVANAYYGAYNQAQDRALGAAGMVPGINNAQFGALDFMRGMGADRQGYNQDVINAQVLQNQQGQMAPMQAIQDYLALVGGVGNSFGSQTARESGNPGLLGVLGAGAKIGGMFI
jgi:hypothetical protein